MMLSQNFFELEASTVEGQSLEQKDEKRRQRKGTKKEVKKKTKKPVGHYSSSKF